MKNKKITFIPSSLEIFDTVDCPKPSKFFIPDWFKNISSNYKKNPIFNEYGRLNNTSVKMCMPFLDSLTSGYIQQTWCDIYIKKENNGVSFSYPRTPEIVGLRENKALKTYDNEFYPLEFYWKSPWISKIAKGYSILICHPLNRLDLPFYTLSGIIDSDKYYHAINGNLPFYIKNDFEGLIPAGTPMYQIIPIKRDFWISKKEKYSKKVDNRAIQQVSFFWEFYKKNFWQKKKYE